MANRHLSRSLALQTLFEWDFVGAPNNQIKAIMTRISTEFGPGLDDASFLKTLVSDVVAKQDKLDRIIEKAAPDWPLSQIAIVDRNVLRLGLYELLFAPKDEVPARVAINEAIELAKTFGGEGSGRFVNGVLGAVYKEMGEPGKDEVPAKKRRPKDVPYEQMPIERLGGAVVYTCNGAGIELALVHDIFGYWTLSKGHIKDGEPLELGTSRELKEELSLDITVGEFLGTNEYIASHPEQGKIRKQVNYFLAEASEPKQLKLGAKKGLTEAKWFALADIPDLKMYDDVVPLVTKAITLLVRK
ncbi:MAG: transcription antitermination factor NusB [Candidatus Vogelbacteria bacterium]|nr:transcription antitermination factor NusB [Candidatus Vogelbacteria bacterium]